MKEVQFKMLLTIVLCCFVFNKIYPQNLQGYLQTIGGTELLRNTTSIKITYECEYYSKDKIVPTKSKGTKVVNSMGWFRIESEVEGYGPRLITFNGKEMKEIFLGFPYSPSEKEKKAYHTTEANMGEPWICLNAEGVKYLGEERSGEFANQIFEVKYKDLVRIFYIGRNDSLLNKVLMFNGVARILYSDYRKVEGLTIPFKKIGYSNDLVEVVTVIKSVEFNIEYPPSFFD